MSSHGGVDIATLKMVIDATDIRTGDAELKKFEATAAKTEAATSKLETRLNSLSKAQRALPFEPPDTDVGRGGGILGGIDTPPDKVATAIEASNVELLASNEKLDVSVQLLSVGFGELSNRLQDVERAVQDGTDETRLNFTGVTLK